MKGVVQFVALVCLVSVVNAQTVIKELAEAVKRLESDEQMKYGIVSFYVVDKSGGVVYEKNSRVGLPVASTQKVITATTAFELLGSNYTYKTNLAYSGLIENNTLKGDLYIVGSGDPTLGSPRFESTKEEVVFTQFKLALAKAGVKSVTGKLYCFDGAFETQTVPGGWIWDDIGNYYGAGVSGLNWRENSYEIKLRSGSTGSTATITSIEPRLSNVELISEATAGKAGSGDNAFIYLPPYANRGFVRGTVPPNEGTFTIKGSFPDPGGQFASAALNAIKSKMEIHGVSSYNSSNDRWELPKSLKVITSFTSPVLPEIMPHFLKKSINLYGEALLKTLGYEKQKGGTTEAGVSVINSFWKSKGLDPNSINITDGSGLSLQSRVTTEGLVKVMHYAKSRPWFSSFSASLPEFNGIKMKSGTITGIKSFTGYVNGYTFAIVVNGFSGSSSAMTGKIYKVLDELK